MRDRERETIYNCANNGKWKLRQTQIRFERTKPSILFDRNFLLTEKIRMFTLKYRSLRKSFSNALETYSNG